MKKYELVRTDSIQIGDVTVYRIRALKNFITCEGSLIVAGDIGGYVGSVDNLSQDDNAWVAANAWVYDYAYVSDNACVSGNARVSDYACVTCVTDILNLGPIGSRNDYATFYATNNGINVKCGCFCDSIDEFCDKVRKKHGNNKHAKTYLKAAELAKMQIGI